MTIKTCQLSEMSDPLRRSLHLPAWHIPYLEKHKIYELFHEIARELVIQKPADHVLFIKQILQNAADCKDVSRILLLHTPRVNCLAIAKEVSKVTGQMIISDEEVCQYLGCEISNISSVTLVKGLASLVRSQSCYSMGWIMINCLRDQLDAKLLVKYGILPTHTVFIVAPFNPDLTNLLYCNVKVSWPNYRRNIVAIKDIFKRTLREIHLEGKQIADVVREICELPRKELQPSIKRVLILGPRGSGRKTQARLLQSNYNLIHIDFEYLLCSVWTSSTELGGKLRKCRNEVCFHSELLTEIINKRVLEPDCLGKGWVLTGFPFTVNDFKCLDSLDTPPNRVIFLESDMNVCRERLQRKTNIYTGSATNIKQKPSADEEKVLRIHPRDHIDMINAELNFYCENYGAIRKYCGSTASVVNANQSERHVHEFITAVLIRSAPSGAPRSGVTDEDSSSSSDDQCVCLPIPKEVADCYVRKM